MWSRDEPVRGGYPDAAFLGLSGLDQMRAGVKGQMPRPPIHHLLGLTPIAASPAAVTFSMPCSPWLQTLPGIFIAGTNALVADAPLGGAILAGLGPGQVVVTSDLSMNFLRPVDVSSERLTARARPIEVGRSLGLAEAIVEDGLGHVVAHATTRCFILQVPVSDDTDDLPEYVAPRYDTPDPYLRPVPEGSVRREMWEEKTFPELVAMLAAGEIPPAPFMDLIGAIPGLDDDGAFAVVPASPWFSSPAGTVYGGFLAYLADAALAGAVGATLDKGEIGASLDLKVQFLRPAFPDGRDLKASARVVHRGRNFAVAQAEITNADGKTIVLASSSSTIRSGRRWGSFAVADEAAGPEAAGAG